jgi:hypothetical protein
MDFRHFALDSKKLHTGRPHEQCSCKAPVPCIGGDPLGLQRFSRRARSDWHFLDPIYGSDKPHELRLAHVVPPPRFRSVTLPCCCQRKRVAVPPTPQTRTGCTATAARTGHLCLDGFTHGPHPCQMVQNSATPCLDGCCDDCPEMVSCLSHLTKTLVHEPLNCFAHDACSSHPGFEVRRLSLPFAVACR